ncbi:MAG TPA: nucleotidyltransferase domain-containing protein [Sedimenticola sp.]|nr:nucleotidyltransferase domain-containing protein [Sedimenticola sp.]
MTDLDTALQTFLKRHPEIRIAILYGSLASGRAGFESDLDLAVELDQPLTAGEKMRLIEELSELTGRPVDLIDLHTVGEPLLGQIVKTGRRLKGSDARFAELLKRHLFAVADFLPHQRRILRERRRAWLRK